MTSNKKSKSPKKSKTDKAGASRAGASRVPADPPIRLGPGLSPGLVRFEWLVAVLVLVAAIVILYPGHVFQDKIFFSPDNQAAAGFAGAAKKAMQEEGIYPVWNPFLFGGMPSFGSLSFTPYVYPPSAVLKLLVKYLFFPQYIWLFFHTFLVGFGTYLLLRDRKVWFMAALSAGVLMMWMPNLVAAGANGHGSQACAVGYIPFALLFWDRLWRGRGTVLNGSALVIVLGFSMLRGHLQIAYYTYALIGLHFLFFSAARIVDGVNGRKPEWTALPRKLFDGLTGAGARYGAGAAVAEVAWAALLLAAIVGCSLLISAVLYLPAHDYAQHSIRGASASGGLDYDYATSWSLHPSEMLTFLLPYSFGFGKDLYIGHMPFTDYPNYVGFVVLAFAAIAMVMARTRFVWFLFFVIAVTTLVSFGNFFPVLYDPLFKWAPFFSKFRVPVMVLILQQVALVLMFGIGFNALLGASPEKARKNAVLGLAVAFLLFMIFILSQGFWSGGFAESIAGKVRGARTASEQIAVARVVGNYLFRDMVRFSIMLAAMFALFYFYFGRKVPARVFCVLILVLGMIDLYLVDRNILHPEKFRKHEVYRIIHDSSAAEVFEQSDDLVEYLQSDTRHFRVLPLPLTSPQRPFSPLFSSNRFMVFGISSFGGYHPAKLQLYEQFYEMFRRALGTGNLQVLHMMNIRYLVAGSELQAFPRIQPVWKGVNYQNEPRFVSENLDAFPRAWMAGAYRVVPGDEALDVLAGTDVDLRREVVLDREPAVKPSAPAAGDTAVAEIVDLGFNEIRIRTRSSSPSILVLSEIYYPDWSVEVDGSPSEMLRANYILRGVALEAGDHEVVFRYDLSLLRKSATISATTFGVFALIIVVGLVLTSRGRRVGSTHRRSDV
jgi:hypothetical protein